MNAANKRMRRQRLGFEFRMKLAADEPRMLGRFDDFDVRPIRRFAGDAESRGEQSFFVFAIEFVAMAMPLADFQLAVCARRE